jgi:excisionase family DNA binding protein
MKAFFSAAEVAKLLGVDRATVIRWIQKGKIKGAIRINGEKTWKIPITATRSSPRPNHESREL